MGTESSRPKSKEFVVSNSSNSYETGNRNAFHTNSNLPINTSIRTSSSLNQISNRNLPQQNNLNLSTNPNQSQHSYTPVAHSYSTPKITVENNVSQSSVNQFGNSSNTDVKTNKPNLSANQFNNLNQPVKNISSKSIEIDSLLQIKPNHYSEASYKAKNNVNISVDGESSTINKLTLNENKLNDNTKRVNNISESNTGARKKDPNQYKRNNSNTSMADRNQNRNNNNSNNRQHFNKNRNRNDNKQENHGNNRGGQGGHRGGNRGRFNNNNNNRRENSNFETGNERSNSNQEMDWFDMVKKQTTTALSPSPPPLFSANDLPLKTNNYGGRYNSAKSESGQSRRGRRGPQQNRVFYLGFKRLEEISEQEPDEILVALAAKDTGLDKLLNSDLSPDFIVLIIRTIGKCCQSVFDQNKAKILINICETDFSKKLMIYLSELPLQETRDKIRNKYFWDNQEQFWYDLLNFYENILILMPQTACDTLSKVIGQTANTLLLLQTKNLYIPDGVKIKSDEIVEKLVLLKSERETVKNNSGTSTADGKRNKFTNDTNEQPPDDFRQISLYPMVNEITNNHVPVFLRENIVDGCYHSIEHYLDVHFRLLREDFIGPLRDGICNYLRQQNQPVRERKRIFNVRFYHNVQFLVCKNIQSQVGIVVQLNTKRQLKSLENSRRFLFGSLLCFTCDNFENVLYGTVLSRDKELITKNQIAVHLINDYGGSNNDDFVNNIMYGVNYIMVECNVFFEPYYHVLKALQSMNEDNFPFKRYIIDVEPDVQVPSYYNNNNNNNYNTNRINYYDYGGGGRVNSDTRLTYMNYQFDALQRNQWPSANELGFDQSQYNAYHAALTKEFCVIQGPPGTGKTYIGLKIAETLLINNHLWNRNGTPILVICFTNHALDQFLEGILKYTKELVRVGGQSKNDELKNYNIRNMVRSQIKRNRDYNNVLYKRHDEIKNCTRQIDSIQKIIEQILNCDRVIDFECFHKFDHEFANSWFSTASNNKIFEWLLGGHTTRKQQFNYQQQQQQQIIQPKDDDDDYDDDDDNDFIETNEERERMIVDSDDECCGYEAADGDNVQSLITDFCNYIMSTNEFEKKIAQLEKEIEQAKNTIANENAQMVLFNPVIAKEDELNKIKNDYEYFKFRMNQIKCKTNIPPKPLKIDFKNPNYLTPDERWGFYAFYLQLYLNELYLELSKLNVNYRNIYKQYEEVKLIEDVNLMRQMKVIGMTTSGAARYQIMLEALKCPIVIVEEAAEVLESHIIVSLTKYCQQLILIGDHKQLRPTTAEYRLAKNCNLDVSLFERMVNNRFECETLNIQHRMRPEIAQLIVPAIYPTLENAPNVQTYPPIYGVCNNVFFVTHTEPEEMVDDTGSRKNVHEAKFLIKLARHFILQGYKPDEITILTTYSGQMFCLWKERKTYMDLLKDVRITVVDNYQGEENKIILLSLVRSNTEANIGFLKTDNRVNVALSRAKEGLFIIGNMDILQQNDNIWSKVRNVLNGTNSIGPYLTLRCLVHTDQLTRVKTDKDFQLVNEGGCTLMCRTILNCNHRCNRLCHVVDREHLLHKCMERCERTCNTYNHPCPDKCWQQPCRPCRVPVPFQLPCGHEQQLPCSMSTDEKRTYRCPTILIDFELPCGHRTNKPCHENKNKYPCPYPCDIRRDCGHACDRRCHVNDDPDHIRVQCFKQCSRNRKNCTSDPPHICPNQCFVDCVECDVQIEKILPLCGHKIKIPCHNANTNNVQCVKPCKRTLSECGHKCKRKCYEPCEPCQFKIDKIIPDCGHVVRNVKCGDQMVTRELCHGTCPRLLKDCGHPCGKKCNEPCRTRCKYLVDNPHPVVCGHRFQIPCYKTKLQFDPSSNELLKHCTGPCSTVLQCTHKCNGTCGKCAQGRLHVTCTEKCNATFVCGHSCGTPCRETCEPCTEKCNYRCKHSRCGKICGELCTQCNEPCSRRCKHIRCSKRCFEICDVPACTEPCAKMSPKCKKHPCMGFCGEQCPPVCRECDPDDETFQILFGYEDEPDVRFVYLEECRHTVEDRGMQIFLQMTREHDDNNPQEINVKRCPRCNTTLTKTQRYSDYFKQLFNDIHAIKQKYYLTDKETEERREQLQLRIVNIRLNNLELYKVSKNLRNLIKDLVNELRIINEQGKRNKQLNVVKLTALQAKIQLIEHLTNIFRNGTKVKNMFNDPQQCKKLYDVSHGYVEFLLSHMFDTAESRMTNQKITDFELELSRFERFIQLCSIEINNNFAPAMGQQQTKQLHETISFLLRNPVKRYTPDADDQLKQLLDKLRRTIDASITVTSQEREQIVRAIGLGKGRWFKCPNGHFYVIGECGGAMQIAKCGECNEKIGGQNHALLSTNRLANEIDGATHAAWSNAANFDMRNYMF